jgi:hypothetical protein
MAAGPCANGEQQCANSEQQRANGQRANDEQQRANGQLRRAAAACKWLVAQAATVLRCHCNSKGERG